MRIFFNIVKAIILCAGKGTRMLPLTKQIPKVIIEVNGKPWLNYLLDNIKKAGIEEVALVVEYKKSKLIEIYPELTFLEPKNMNGTGDIGLIKNFTKEKEFLLFYGDSLWSVEDIKKLMKMEGNVIVATKTENPEKYGILNVKDGKMNGIIEKPKEFIGNLMNTGLYKFTPEIFEKIKNLKPSVRGELELTDAIKQLEMKVLEVKFWLDLGCKEDIEKASKILSHSF